MPAEHPDAALLPSLPTTLKVDGIFESETQKKAKKRASIQMQRFTDMEQARVEFHENHRADILKERKVAAREKKELQLEQYLLKSRTPRQVGLPSREKKELQLEQYLLKPRTPRQVGLLKRTMSLDEISYVNATKSPFRGRHGDSSRSGRSSSSGSNPSDTDRETARDTDRSSRQDDQRERRAKQIAKLSKQPLGIALL